MYKLIATDLDGTLLNSEHKISLKNKEYIILAQEKGIKFVLASGRPITAMKNFEKELKLAEYSSYLIAYNGAEIYDCKNMKTIYSTPLNENQIEYIVGKSNQYNIPFVTYCNDTIYASDINDDVMIEAKYTNMPIKKINSINEIDKSKLLKFMFIGEPEKVSAIYSELITNKDKNLSLAISDPHFLEITDNKANKGIALKTLCKYTSVKNDDDILYDVIKKFALNS